MLKKVSLNSLLQGYTQEPDLVVSTLTVIQQTKMTPKQSFDIYVYDYNSGKAKIEELFTLGSFKNVQGKNLSDIRAMLNNENGLSAKLYVRDCSTGSRRLCLY